MKYLLLLFFCFSLLKLSAQNEVRSFLVMFYNVENLFDTIDSPDTNDKEFLPSSEKKWDSRKYYKKLENLSKVILACDSSQIPDIIGLSEVENKTVLKDLCRTLHYQKPIYQYLHEDSEDPRGIDVAFLYNPNRFSVTMWRKIPVMTPGQKDAKDRDILYVKGTAPTGDTLHVFVNHWKSRVGGADNTETRRVFAAMTLKARCDSILALNPAANLIIMGDFNDDPENKSIFQILQANNKRRNRDLFDLFNLHYDIHNFYGAGTLLYSNAWYLFDQIIISNHLLINSKGLLVRPEAGSILKHEWMLYKPEGQAMQPQPTYEGKKYIGGYSDHLPVFVKFTY